MISYSRTNTSRTNNKTFIMKCATCSFPQMIFSLNSNFLSIYLTLSVLAVEGTIDNRALINNIDHEVFLTDAIWSI